MAGPITPGGTRDARSSTATGHDPSGEAGRSAPRPHQQAPAKADSSPDLQGSSLLDGQSLDALARWLLERARPLVVDLVATEDALDQVLRLRHRVAVAEGWVGEERLPEGLERDEYDDRALHVAAWDGSAVVGTVRVVLSSAGGPLPTERAFGIVVEPRGAVADWGRLVVEPGHRGGGHVIMLALLGRAWLATRAHGASVCVGVASRQILDLYSSMGVEATVLAGPRPYWGEERYAARLLGLAGDAAERMAQ